MTKDLFSPSFFELENSNFQEMFLMFNKKVKVMKFNSIKKISTKI